MDSQSLNSEIQKRIQAHISDFQNLPAWEDKYKKIISLGKQLSPIDEKYKTDENLVRGCQSQVWLYASLNSEKKMILQGDSDALIVRGLVALVLSVYSNTSPSEILESPMDFLKSMGFEGNLSPSRTNGLFAMIKQIRNYAIAFDYLLKSQV